jgi:hypothetical protein
VFWVLGIHFCFAPQAKSVEPFRCIDITKNRFNRAQAPTVTMAPLVAIDFFFHFVDSRQA